MSRRWHGIAGCGRSEAQLQRAASSPLTQTFRTPPKDGCLDPDATGAPPPEIAPGAQPRHRDVESNKKDREAHRAPPAGRHPPGVAQHPPAAPRPHTTRLATRVSPSCPRMPYPFHATTVPGDGLSGPEG